MMNWLQGARIDNFVKRPRSRRANLVERGVLKVRRSDSEVKRNAEIGLFTKSSSAARAFQGKHPARGGIVNPQG